MYKTNREIKSLALDYLTRNYIMMVTVAFLLGYLENGGFQIRYTTDANGMIDLSSLSVGTLNMYVPIIASYAIVVVLAYLVVSIVLVQPLRCGMRNWFRHQPDRKTDGVIAFAFKKENYMRVVKTIFFRDLTILGGYLLFIIPGVIMQIRYIFVDYLLYDHPELSPEEVLAAGRQMTEGKKMDILVFELSFLLWEIVSIYTNGLLGIFFVAPYKAMAEALLYLNYIEVQGEPYEQPYYY